MTIKLILEKAGYGKTYGIKVDILNTLFNSNDNVIVIESDVFSTYNEYEFLVNKSHGSIISPAKGINKDIDSRFIAYDVFLGRDGLNYHRYFLMALSDTFHRVVNNSKKGIKTYIYLDEIGMYFNKEGVFEMINDFVKACSSYDCDITIASKYQEEVKESILAIA